MSGVWLLIAVILIVIIIAVAVAVSQNHHSRGRCSQSVSPGKGVAPSSTPSGATSSPLLPQPCDTPQVLQGTSSCQRQSPPAQAHRKPPSPGSAAVVRPHHNTFSTVGMQNRERPVTTYDDFVDSAQIPGEFKSDTQWPGLVMNSLDQSTCGSCWAFSSSTALSDRIRIASKGKLLRDDFISPFDTAACNICDFSDSFNMGREVFKKKESSLTSHDPCSGVCHGNYIDSALEYLVQEGGISAGSDTEGNVYVCTARNQSSPSVVYKGTMKYLLSNHGVPEFVPGFNASQYQDSINTTVKKIQTDIMQFGPVSALIRIFTPQSSDPSSDPASIYNYAGMPVDGAVTEDGVYNRVVTTDDKDEGYHAIVITGWGISPNGDKYWWVRNSWGKDWGMGGYFKLPMGSNYVSIEADVWGILPDTKSYIVEPSVKAERSRRALQMAAAHRIFKPKGSKTSFVGRTLANGRLDIVVAGVSGLEKHKHVRFALPLDKKTAAD